MLLVLRSARRLRSLRIQSSRDTRKMHIGKSVVEALGFRVIGGHGARDKGGNFPNWEAKGSIGTCIMETVAGRWREAK